MKIIFMGSSNFGLPTLKALVENHNVIAVYSNPPKASGRGMIVQKTPTHEFAQLHGIPCHTPQSLKNEAETIMELQPDFIIVAAYGFILPQKILDIPKFGCVNIHGSLLPHLRGAAPIQHSLLLGDVKTGITLIKIDAGMDTGDILSTREYFIKDNENFLTLLEHLSNLAVAPMLEFLDDHSLFLKNRIQQNHSLATFSKKITKEDFCITFDKSTAQIIGMVKAFYPRSYFLFNGTRVKVLCAEKADTPKGTAFGFILDDKLTISTIDGAVRVTVVRPESKSEMSGHAFMLSRKQFIGHKL